MPSSRPRYGRGDGDVCPDRCLTATIKGRRGCLVAVSELPDHLEKSGWSSSFSDANGLYEYRSSFSRRPAGERVVLR